MPMMIKSEPRGAAMMIQAMRLYDPHSSGELPDS